MKRLLKGLVYFALFLIIAESLSRGFIFYRNLRLSYRINKEYYNFKGSFREYLKEYSNFTNKNKGENSVIVKDVYNRKFYKPNLVIESQWLRFKTNSFGMKERELDLRKDEKVYRIICLGSSCLLAGSEGNTFPNLLEKKLRDEYNAKARFEVINAGISGQNVLQGFMNFALNWRKLNPDMVIIDFVLDDVPANEPIYLENHDELTMDSYVKEYLWERIGICKLIDLIYAEYFRPNRSSKNAFTQEGLVYYETVLESLVLLAKGMGCKAVLLSCGIAVDKKHNFEMNNPKRKLLESHFKGMPAKAAVQNIEEYNKIMHKVARRNNAVFIDMSEAVPKDNEHFIDATHRSDKGNEVFATVLMEKLESVISDE